MGGGRVGKACDCADGMKEEKLGSVYVCGRALKDRIRQTRTKRQAPRTRETSGGVASCFPLLVR